MKITKKAVALTICLLLVATMGVFGTMAYLTDTDDATNTFTVGSVTITLDEADVNPDGTLKSEERVKENEYHLIPGHTYIKDPTVTMGKDSELAYVRMLVTVENIDKLKATLKEPKYYSDNVFLLQMLCLDENDNNTWNNEKWIYEKYKDGVYEFRYYTTVDGADGKLEPLFETITVPGEDVDSDNISNLKDVKIVVVAHAVQADGFANDDEAWAAFDKQNAKLL